MGRKKEDDVDSMINKLMPQVAKLSALILQRAIETEDIPLASLTTIFSTFMDKFIALQKISPTPQKKENDGIKVIM